MRYLVAAGLCALAVVALVRSTRSGPSDEPLTSAVQLSELCNKGTTFPDAAPYAAETPRTVAVFQAPAGNGGYDRVERLPAQLQGERRDPYPQWDTSDATAIQLVACVRRTSEGEQVGECPLDAGEPVPLHAARYEVSVHEARTGEQVGSYEQGWEGDDCPAVAVLLDAERPRVFSTIPREPLMRSLFAFVGAPPPPATDVEGAQGEGVTISGDWTGAFTEAANCTPPTLSEIPSSNLEGLVIVDGPAPLRASMLLHLRPDQTAYDGQVVLPGVAFTFSDAARGQVLLEELPSGESRVSFHGLELVDPGGSFAVRLDGSLSCL